MCDLIFDVLRIKYKRLIPELQFLSNLSFKGFFFKALIIYVADREIKEQRN